MNTLLAKTAEISLLALAAVPLIALSVAHAQPAGIKVSDLNLSRPADVRTFHARVDHAANQVCTGGPEARDLGRFDACRKAVRIEAMDKLSQSQSQARAATAVAG